MLIEYSYQLTASIGIANYGLAVIILTVGIKLVLFPLTNKQLKSMRGMQQIQPKMKELQERYKGDKETLNQKIMELYKENNVSPLGGCLPLIIQMPIFIAFYRALMNLQFTDINHAGFLWIPNIGSPDPFYIIALLAAGTTFAQQRLSITDIKEPMQRSMLYMMPVMMGFIAVSLPAGLPLYWVTFNILGIIQQKFVNRDRPIIDTNSEPVKKSVDKEGDDSNASRGKKGKKR